MLVNGGYASKQGYVWGHKASRFVNGRARWGHAAFLVAIVNGVSPKLEPQAPELDATGRSYAT